jgi:hypothetical protein
MEVNVPHSCTVSPEKTAAFSEPNNPAEVARQQASSKQHTAREPKL